MDRVRLALALLAFAATLGTARADAIRYRAVAGPPVPAVTIEVPYTFGKHQQTVNAIRGELIIDSDSLTSAHGRLAVPIDGIVSDNPERDCHLREALGLDYGRSRFPKKHACDGAHRLPASGPDSVAFSDVTFEVERARVGGDVLRGGTGGTSVDVEGAWTIHGVTRPARLSLTLSPDASLPGALRVRGRTSFRLKDFGVVVKSTGVLFVKSNVGEVVTATFDVLLAPAPGRAP
jgi:polyisoprenoid-binding protein YceI